MGKTTWPRSNLMNVPRFLKALNHKHFTDVICVEYRGKGAPMTGTCAELRVIQREIFVELACKVQDHSSVLQSCIARHTSLGLHVCITTRNDLIVRQHMLHKLYTEL